MSQDGREQPRTERRRRSASLSTKIAPLATLLVAAGPFAVGFAAWILVRTVTPERVGAYLLVVTLLVVVAAALLAFLGARRIVRALYDLIEARVRERTAKLEREILLRKEAERALRTIAERRFSAVAESAHDAIISAGADGRITYFNPGATKTFGWSPDEALGRPLTMLMPERYREAHERGLGRYLETGEGPILERTVELEGIRRGGREFPVELSVSVWEDLNGKPAFTAILRDVTDRKRTEEELRRAKDTAERASRAKSRFLANMSHEIRTPMNGVIGMTQLLLTLPLEPQQREYARTILSSADTLLGLLNDVLDLSKIEAERVELQSVPFSLREIVRDTVRTFASRAAEKDVELVQDVDDDVPDALRGDPVRLGQILNNLVGNAVKLTDEGEVVVRVSVDEADADVARLHFAVSDTGPGIPEAARERIFDAFEQVGAGASGRGGTGLGLAIARELAELMDGAIWVESTSGAGSTFHFTAALAVREGSAVRPPVALEGLRALVVDDNTTSRVVLEGLLTGWGLRAEGADSGAAALARLRQAAAAGDPFRVALLDSDMPGMSGRQVADEIEREPIIANVGLVMLVSAAPSEHGRRARHVDAARVLTKPIEPPELLGAIRRLVEVEEPETKEAPAPTPMATNRRLSILLAEDDPVNQKVAVSLLERRGHEVDVASNGREAVEALERRPYDLVLMDLRMPEMDGLEATRRVRANEAARGGHVPIVAMTAHAMQGDEELCREAGMDDYVPKPVRAEALYAAVERAAPHAIDPATAAEE